ncbi:MAG TPA: hypothetical protein VFD49_24895 [Candidatus Dormibacteraeota bacterium]|jgi:hypothetical protein|nr:hypothetical protein [Candidatus Dormibacteraeota bacterium]
MPQLDPLRDPVEPESGIGETCPYCGRDRSEWTENEGEGVSGGGLTYCSQDCLLRDQARG